MAHLVALFAVMELACIRATHKSSGQSSATWCCRALELWPVWIINWIYIYFLFIKPESYTGLGPPCKHRLPRSVCRWLSLGYWRSRLTDPGYFTATQSEHPSLGVHTTYSWKAVGGLVGLWFLRIFFFGFFVWGVVILCLSFWFGLV